MMESHKVSEPIGYSTFRLINIEDLNAAGNFF